MAVCIGDPLSLIARGSELPYGVLGYDFIGGLKGEAMEVIRDQFTGFPIPVHA